MTRRKIKQFSFKTPADKFKKYSQINNKKKKQFFTIFYACIWSLGFVPNLSLHYRSLFLNNNFFYFAFFLLINPQYWKMNPCHSFVMGFHHVNLWNFFCFNKFCRHFCGFLSYSVHCCSHYSVFIILSFVVWLVWINISHFILIPYPQQAFVNNCPPTEHSLCKTYISSGSITL